MYIIISCRIYVICHFRDMMCIIISCRIMMSFQRYDVYYYLMQDYDVVSEI